MAVELVWDGKYDKNGKKSSPLKIALPFQTVETVNESAQQRQKAMDMFGANRPSEWRNRLIWGDKKYVLSSLLPEFAGKVDLIYIDPPFDTGADFSFNIQVDGEGFTKEPSMIEQKAYRDTWGRGLDSYLHWFYETIVQLRELLTEKGSIYVHLDWHAGHYAKTLIDEVFGTDRFMNEIVWLRTTGHSDSHKWNHSHDVIYFYTKSPDYTWREQFIPYSQEHLDSSFRNVEEGTGRRFSIGDLMAGGLRNGSSGKAWHGVDPAERGGHWQYTIEQLERLDKEGKVYWPPNGRVPRLKRYLDEMPGRTIKSIWDDISPVQGSAKERVEYQTQKPEALLDRIIKSSSSENDLILDCFAGSGTTAAVAEKLNRRWIACDLGRFAIHTTRKRLLAIPNVKPFVVQNLGKYERQLWQSVEFGEGAQAIVHSYRKFILELYKAEALSGYNWLHGVKSGRMVHIGSVDSPVSLGDITQIASEFRKAIGSGKDAPRVNEVDVLGWDFAFDMNEIANATGGESKHKTSFHEDST